MAVSGDDDKVYCTYCKSEMCATPQCRVPMQRLGKTRKMCLPLPIPELSEKFKIFYCGF